MTGPQSTNYHACCCYCYPMYAYIYIYICGGDHGPYIYIYIYTHMCGIHIYVYVSGALGFGNLRKAALYSPQPTGAASYPRVLQDTRAFSSCANFSLRISYMSALCSPRQPWQKPETFDIILLQALERKERIVPLPRPLSDLFIRASLTIYKVLRTTRPCVWMWFIMVPRLEKDSEFPD